MLASTTDNPVSGHHQPLTIPRSVAFGCTVHHLGVYRETVAFRFLESAHFGVAPFLRWLKPAVSWAILMNMTSPR
jgi:hypothetical protein